MSPLRTLYLGVYGVTRSSAQERWSSSGSPEQERRRMSAPRTNGSDEGSVEQISTVTGLVLTGSKRVA